MGAALYYLFCSICEDNDLKNRTGYPTKKYPHFDSIISYNKVQSYVENPDRILSHSFFPFIHYQIKFTKYNGKKRQRKEKIRDISYASHIDGYIYKYYGEKLNESYNIYATKYKIDEIVTAYRNNKKGKCNIHFAQEVINIIHSSEEAYIMIGDFEKFFDTLDHKYLTKMVCKVIGCEKLPTHLHKIIKSISRFSYIEKEDIKEELGDNFNKATRYFSNIKDFRSFKKKKEILHINKQEFGIPQGTAISAILANIYMIEFDERINKLVQEYGGIYRRYSDDFIIVIPKKKGSLINKIEWQNIVDCVFKEKDKIPQLKISESKTDTYYFNKAKIYKLEEDMNQQQDTIDYLGFVFDGKNVWMRPKSVYKFYRKAYSLIDIAKEKSKQKNDGRLTYKRKIYKHCTYLGALPSKSKGNKKEHGNFIGYASRAQKIFDEYGHTNNLMEKQVNRHWNKIQKRIHK